MKQTFYPRIMREFEDDHDDPPMIYMDDEYA